MRTISLKFNPDGFFYIESYIIFKKIKCSRTSYHLGCTVKKKNDHWALKGASSFLLLGLHILEILNMVSCSCCWLWCLLLHFQNIFAPAYQVRWSFIFLMALIVALAQLRAWMKSYSVCVPTPPSCYHFIFNMVTILTVIHFFKSLNECITKCLSIVEGNGGDF